MGGGDCILVEGSNVRVLMWRMVFGGRDLGSSFLDPEG